MIISSAFKRTNVDLCHTRAILHKRKHTEYNSLLQSILVEVYSNDGNRTGEQVAWEPRLNLASRLGTAPKSFAQVRKRANERVSAHINITLHTLSLLIGFALLLAFNRCAFYILDLYSIGHKQRTKTFNKITQGKHSVR